MVFLIGNGPVQRVKGPLGINGSALTTLPEIDTFANSVDPDDTTHKSRLIRIYTVCYSVLIFNGCPYL